MSYKRMREMDIYHVITRWRAGYKLAAISAACDLARKTVRKYIALAEDAGLCRTQPLPPKAELLECLQKLIPHKACPQPGQSAFAPYLDEIITLVTAETDPVKPKTAYEILCENHDISVSYSSFKRFVREHVRELHTPAATTCRFETDPGEEMQIDYGKMGRLIDPTTGKNRDVYAFIGVLSCCRLKFVEFVYKQDQGSFTGSHIKMFECFGGAPERLVIDNLKAGVVKADLYDPDINRAYQEMADHYGCFIDPARPYSPKDKGKVERAVQVVREQFRKLKAIYADLDIARANREIQRWCTEINGMKEHGTTGLKPYEAFLTLEKNTLKPLPAERFEIAAWKQAKVHADQYIQFEKKFYSVPNEYVGQQVWVRATADIIQVYLDHTLIKKHVVGAGKRQTDFTDFPEDHQLMMQRKEARLLIERSACVGPRFEAFITQVLEPHAMLNYRRVLGFPGLKDKNPWELLEQAAGLASRYQIKTPKQLQQLMQKIQTSQQENPISISEQTQEIIREPDYFIQ